MQSDCYKFHRYKRSYNKFIRFYEGLHLSELTLKGVTIAISTPNTDWSRDCMGH